MVPRDAPDLECLVEILQFLDDGDQQHDDGGGDVDAGGGRGEGDAVARSSMVSWCRGRPGCLRDEVVEEDECQNPTNILDWLILTTN